MPWSMSAFIREKNKVAGNEKQKKIVGFLIPKVWQILKRFAGTFRRAQTIKL